MTTGPAEKIRRADRLPPVDEAALVPGEAILGASLEEAARLAENWVEDL